MDAVLTDEQKALAEAGQSLAGSGLADARILLDGGEAPARPTADLFDGFNGLGIADDQGGAGGTMVDLAILVRELGRTVCPTPWVSHQAALQVAAAAGLDVTDGLARDQRWVLVDGAPTAVRDGTGATTAVVVDGDRVSVCPVQVAGIRTAMDPTRPMADLDVQPAVSASETGGVVGRRRAQVLIAADLCGVGLGAVERAIAYALERQQFGKTIATFQGVSHQL